MHCVGRSISIQTYFKMRKIKTRMRSHKYLYRLAYYNEHQSINSAILYRLGVDKIRDHPQKRFFWRAFAAQKSRSDSVALGHFEKGPHTASLQRSKISKAEGQSSSDPSVQAFYLEGG